MLLQIRNYLKETYIIKIGDLMMVYDISQNFKTTAEDWKIGKNYYWILATPKELSDLKINLDSECIEECNNLNQSSKIIYFNDYIFMVFNILEYDNREVLSKELNIFLGKDYIITVYKDKSDIIEDFLSDIKEDKNCFMLKEQSKPCILLYYILDRIIVRNYNVISELESEADKIEISILKNPSNDKAHDLINLRRQVYKIRKFLNPLRYIGDSLLLNENNIIDKDNIRYYKNLNNKIDKLMLSLENLVQDLALVREAFESEISNKTNELMKIFTLVAALFLPLDLISGLFGMNLDNIPLQDKWYAYYLILVIMVTIALALFYVFKKKKWL